MYIISIMDGNILYFMTLLPKLEGIYLLEVWEKILRKIARRVHHTCLYPSDWKDFVAEIGINDTAVLEEIEIAATTQRELYLYVAFTSVLQYRYTLHDVIQALINLQRADVLLHIKDEINEFLEDRERRLLNLNHHAYLGSCSSAVREGLSQINGNVSSRNLPCGTETDTFNHESAEASTSDSLENCISRDHKADKQISDDKNKNYAETKDSFAYDFLEPVHCEKKLKDIPFIKCSKQLGENHAYHHAVLKMDMADSPTKTSVCSYTKASVVDVPKSSVMKPACNNPELIVNIPKASPKADDEPISVFIPYTQKRVVTGIQFANRLRKAGFKVITISDAEFMIRIDRSGFLKILLEKVDFVVPVICEEYVLCVRPTGMNRALSNSDATTNRFIFTWIHSEFEENQCFNVRVKPVIVEGFDKQLIRNEPLFKWVHQLWDEVDSLVKILRDTKKMMQSLMATWNQHEFVEKWMKYLNEH